LQPAAFKQAHSPSFHRHHPNQPGKKTEEDDLFERGGIKCRRKYTQLCTAYFNPVSFRRWHQHLVVARRRRFTTRSAGERGATEKLARRKPHPALPLPASREDVARISHRAKTPLSPQPGSRTGSCPMINSCNTRCWS